MDSAEKRVEMSHKTTERIKTNAGQLELRIFFAFTLKRNAKKKRKRGMTSNIREETEQKKKQKIQTKKRIAGFTKI